MTDTCQTQVGFHGNSIETNALSGIVFMHISYLSEIIWENDRQFIMMILIHEAGSQVFVDIKKFDNI